MKERNTRWSMLPLNAWKGHTAPTNEADRRRTLLKRKSSFIIHVSSFPTLTLPLRATNTPPSTSAVNWASNRVFDWAERR